MLSVMRSMCSICALYVDTLCALCNALCNDSISSSIYDYSNDSVMTLYVTLVMRSVTYPVPLDANCKAVATMDN